jgi:regulator of protease activity HflC (stomatin/prohibitin superfamily)
VGFSKETQEVDFDVALNYHIDPHKIDQLYTRVGPNWFDVLVSNRVLNDAKEQTVALRSIDIAPNRETIRRRLQEQLRSELAGQGVLIDNVSITNIQFSKRFTAAIENKQEATQLAQAAQARIAQRQAEADQRVAIARGDAQSTLVRARAQAQANKLLQQALTPEFIDYQRVLALQRLASSPNIQLVPSNAFFTVPQTTRTGTRTSP